MKVTHDPSRHRFVARVGGDEATLVYSDRDGGVIELRHTEIPLAAQGHGIGNSLADAAFRYARDHALHVVPTCPFVRHWLTTHPEWEAIVVKPG